MTSLKPWRARARTTVIGLLVIGVSLDGVMAQEGEPAPQVYDADLAAILESSLGEGGPSPLYLVPMRPLLASGPARLSLIEHLSMVVHRYTAAHFEGRDVDLYQGPAETLERPAFINQLALSTLSGPGCSSLIGFLQLDKFWSKDLPINYDANTATAEPALCVHVRAKDEPGAQPVTFAQRPAVIRFSGKSVLMLSSANISGSAKNANTPTAQTEPDRVTDWLFPVVLVADAVFSLGCGHSKSSTGVDDPKLPDDYCTTLQDELASAYAVLTVLSY